MKPRREVPLEQAIREVAAASDLSEDTIRKYAAEMKAKFGNPVLSAGTVIAVGNAARTVMKLAAEAQEAGVRLERGRLLYGNVDLTHYVREVSLSSDIPHNPANRRTFHLAGKPYHYVQSADGRLRTEPGESPWI